MGGDLTLIKKYIYRSKYLIKLSFIYEDKHNKTVNLIFTQNEGVCKILELNDRITDIEGVDQIPNLENVIQGFDENDKINFYSMEKGCLSHNSSEEINDKLYLNCYKTVYIIDLARKIVIDKINLEKDIYSSNLRTLLNKDNDKIIFLAINKVYCYDVIKKTFIGKYKFKFDSIYHSIQLKRIICDNVELLFIDGTDNKIRFILSEDIKSI